NAYPTRRWVTTGPYAVVSHPIYLGFLLALFGAAVVLKSPAGVWIVAPLAALGCAALTFGYEAKATAKRLSRQHERPWLRLPDAVRPASTFSERLAAALLVFPLWVVLYRGFAGLPVRPDAWSTWLAGEFQLPIWPS